MVAISSIFDMHQAVSWDKNSLNMAKKNTTITSFMRRISRLSKAHFVVRALARRLCTMLLFGYKASVSLNAYRLKLKK